MRALLFAGLAACGPGGGETDTNDEPLDTDTAPTAADVEVIFDERCVACHQGEFADGGMDLTQGVAVVVDVPSTEVDTMVRVAPGSLDDSYLWHKVQGTAASVGGVDSQMPFDGTAPLGVAEMQAIRGWIEGGALD